MRLMRILLTAASLLGFLATANAQEAQQPSPPPAQAPAAGAPAIRAESKIVRVDVVVTDKKGNYIHDLALSDFKVFEDDKQQHVSNFSVSSDPASPEAQGRHYLVLFFDNSTMDIGDQPRARAAAAKFIDANAGPDRVMAVAEFGGALRITQNFTMNAERLKQAATGVKTSAVSPNATAPTSDAASAMGLNIPTLGPSLSSTEADFGAYSVLLAIRSLAKNLATIPGRKSLILFTSGFALTPERDSELTATIDACNKANVVIYPLDVRGLDVPLTAMPGSGGIHAQNRADSWSSAANSERSRGGSGPRPGLQLASYHPTAELAATADPQRGGGGGGGHGGGGGGGGGVGGGGAGGGHGGTGGGTGGTGGGKGGTGGGGKGGTGGTGGGGKGGTTSPGGGTMQPNSFGNPNFTNPRAIVPSFPEGAITNQQVLYALAEGTGGFTIFNTNDLLPGLQKIAHEQNEYYLLGYAPADSLEGSCHTLKVKVDRGGTIVRSRSGYCNIKPTDLLAGKPVEKDLELRASAPETGNMSGTIEAPYLYTSPNEARVNVTMEIASTSVEFAKVKGKYHADINVLGIATRPDGTVAARFSDQVTMDLEKDAWKKFTETPMRYENQFAIAPGKYRLSVVLESNAQHFGKYETPLEIDPYDGRAFTLSGVVLTNKAWKVADLGGALDAELLADRMPLVVHSVQFVPSASNHFKKTDKVALYAQMYDPHMADANPPALRVSYQIVNTKTGKSVLSTGLIDASSFVEKGTPVIPVALIVPLENCPPGNYRLELQAGEAGGAVSAVRTADFATD
jgi:VWFA-related protein